MENKSRLQKTWQAITGPDEPPKKHDLYLSDDAMNGDINTVLQKVRANVDPDSFGYRTSMTDSRALTEACRNGRLDIVLVLLGAGADPNFLEANPEKYRDTPLYKDQDSPLCIAAAAGRGDIARALLAAGADVNADRSSTFESPALSWAASNGNVKTMKILYDHGADVNAVDCYGRKPFHYAAFGFSKEAVQFFLERGADVNMKATDGYTPLDHLLSRKDSLDRDAWKTVTLLLTHGASTENHSNWKIPLEEVQKVWEFEKKIERDYIEMQKNFQDHPIPGF